MERHPLPDALRVRPRGLYAHLRSDGALPTLRWSTGCQGQARYGSANGDVIVVVGSNGNPRGKHSIRWVAPKQGPQPFMFRRRLEDAVALAERVLRIKGRIA